MKIKTIFRNLDSDDQFEGLTIFEDGFRAYGSEKDLILISSKGEVVASLHKVGLDEPHVNHLYEGPQIGDPEPINFTRKRMVEWLKIMGKGAGIDTNKGCYTLGANYKLEFTPHEDEC